MRHDNFIRQKAIELFELGYAERTTALELGLSINIVHKWLYTYRALGKDALLMSIHRKYDYDLKLAAVKDVIDGGLLKPDVMKKYGIASKTALDRWCREYQNQGSDALLPKKKGRKVKPKKKTYATREEELEARIQELELELEIQKRINALVGEIERKQQRH